MTQMGQPHQTQPFHCDQHNVLRRPNWTNRITSILVTERHFDGVETNKKRICTQAPHVLPQFCSPEPLCLLH